MKYLLAAFLFLSSSAFADTCRNFSGAWHDSENNSVRVFIQQGSDKIQYAVFNEGTIFGVSDLIEFNSEQPTTISGVGIKAKIQNGSLIIENFSNGNLSSRSVYKLESEGRLTRSFTDFATNVETVRNYTKVVTGVMW